MERRVGNQHARRSIDITRAKRCPPSLFIFLNLVRGCSSLAIRTFQIGTNIQRIRLGVIFQLFHDDDVVIIFAVGDFDETVVGSLRIRVLGYGFRSLRIVVSRAIGIYLAVHALLPLDSIAGDITCIMTKCNCACFISRGLIANGRAIGRGDDCLMTSGQSAYCVRASRTASNTYRRTATHHAVVDHLTIIIIVSS